MLTLSRSIRGDDALFRSSILIRRRRDGRRFVRVAWHRIDRRIVIAGENEDRWRGTAR
jgi:hypothetical protein